MNYSDFVRCAILEDSRNVFSENNGIKGLPESLISFYSKINPTDVEVTFPDIGAVRFYPTEKLADLQKDYQLPDGCFVFATCNGDPIFVLNGNVMSTLPEVFRPEMLATDFMEFLNKYISSKM